MSLFRDWFFSDEGEWPDDTNWILCRFSFMLKDGKTKHEDEEYFEDTEENRDEGVHFKWIMDNYRHVIDSVNGVVSVQLFGYVWGWNPPSLEE